MSIQSCKILWDFIALFPVLLETNVPVLLHRFVLGLSVSTVFHIPTLSHPFFFILPFLEFCHVFERHAFDLQVVTVVIIKVVY